MPRKYKCKGNVTEVIDQNKFREAKILIEQGSSIRKAAKDCGLHEASIRRHLKYDDVTCWQRNVYFLATRK